MRHDDGKTTLERWAEDRVAKMPGRQCLCQGDGATWVDVSACPVHTVESSPLAEAVQRTWEQSLAYGRGYAEGMAHGASPGDDATTKEGR